MLSQEYGSAPKFSGYGSVKQRLQCKWVPLTNYNDLTVSPSSWGHHASSVVVSQLLRAAVRAIPWTRKMSCGEPTNGSHQAVSWAPQHCQQQLMHTPSMAPTTATCAPYRLRLVVLSNNCPFATTLTSASPSKWKMNVSVPAALPPEQRSSR